MENKKFGIQIGGNGADRLCYLRSADDLLLLATSKRQVCRMLDDFCQAATEVGLTVHPDKTKILTNNTGVAKHWVEVAGGRVEVLGGNGSLTYLGRRLHPDRLHDSEIEARLERGWAKFFSQKKELCCKHAALRSRLKLFHATVSPTVLYGSGSWTMSADRERLLRTTQRRMLRILLGSFRRPDSASCSTLSDAGESEEKEETQQDGEDDYMEIGETWVEWMQRTTHILEAHMKKTGLEDWVVIQRRRKWRLAGHCARRVDQRWSKRLLTWWPVGGARARGHPKLRWIDEINLFMWRSFGFAADSWTQLAASRELWSGLEGDFARVKC